MISVEHPQLLPRGALVVGPSIWVVAGSLQFVLGSTLLSSIGFGYVCSLAGLLALMIARGVRASLRLPPDARDCVEAAVAAARIDGLCDVAGGAVRHVEPDFMIVSVYHGLGRPTPRSYFGVHRRSLVATKEAQSWRPRGLK